MSKWPDDAKYCTDEFEDWCRENEVDLGWKRDQIWWDCWTAAIIMARERANRNEGPPT